MFIHGIGTATPPHRYTQRECWEAYCESPYLGRLSSRSHAILRKVLSSDNGIQTRYFTMPDLREAFSYDPNMLHRRFAENAPVIAAQAATRALDAAGLSIQDIDALVITTCTGYLCPGLTSYVSERLGLRPTAGLFDLVGHGCGAAMPNLQLARALLDSRQAERVLSVSVEICSAAFYVDNDPGVLISTCLFGDGAGAMVLSREAPVRGRRMEFLNFASVLNAKDRDLLRFESRDGMLRNVLDKSIPVLVVDHVRDVLQRLLKQAGMQQEQIAEWILHAGGRDVLAALQAGIVIPAEKLGWSAAVLRDYGNISSPCVIFALEKALQANAPGGTWFMSAFGAGISCHGALLRVEDEPAHR